MHFAISSLFLASSIGSTLGLGCPGSSSDGVIPTQQDIIDEGWQLVAWAQGTGGMFNGNTDLNPTQSYGTAPSDLNNFPSTKSDFQIPYSNLLSSQGNEILFITGDHKVWGYMHWEMAFPLKAVSPFTLTRSPVDQQCCSGGNVVWFACQGDNLGIQKNCGHILYRPASEDPWISIANGDHFEGYNRANKYPEDLMVWGENNYNNDGKDLKNKHGGMKVYIRPRQGTPVIDRSNIGVCPALNSSPGANGDPHIKTWDGQQYDFHGVCDLVLLHNPGFMGGLGMDIHIRTKRTLQYFSYINTAVLRIGDTTLEIMGKYKKNLYWVNGVAGDQLVGDTVLDMTLSGFPIHYKQLSPREQEYSVLLGNVKIIFKTWNSMVRVDVENPTAENFATSVGLMGTFPDSLKMGRDNSTIIDDLNDFGQEWQVLPSESKLFHNIDGPQAPTPCEIPTSTDLRRHLAKSEVSRKSAEKACARIRNKDEFDLCVFDVIATSDKNVAHAY